MKKTYIAPEVEIKRFNTEDIMNGSAVTVTSGAEVSNPTVQGVDVSYDKLFTN